MTFQLNKIYESKNSPGYRILILTVGSTAAFARCVSNGNLKTIPVGDEYALRLDYFENFEEYKEPEVQEGYIAFYPKGKGYHDPGPTFGHALHPTIDSAVNQANKAHDYGIYKVTIIDGVIKTMEVQQ